MSQTHSSGTSRTVSVRWAWLVIAALGAAAAFTYSKWSPPLLAGLAAWRAGTALPAGSDGHVDEHAGHDHGAGGDPDSLSLSEQARANIGLKTAKVELRSFDRTIAVPGIVAERPGRSTIEVTAPLTGVVTRIYPIAGEAVQAGQPLFEMRLTHEELVQAQADFLRTVEELDVIAQEVKRLEQVAVGGAVAGKTVLERKYEQQRQNAVLRAQTQSLLLHGLSQEQVDNILKQRMLLQNMLVKVPEESNAGADPARAPVYQVQRLKVEKGQHVAAGDTLASLTDHAELFIEGNAFERDIPDINKAVENGRQVTAVLESAGVAVTIPGLSVVYLSGQVDPESRSFHFYVSLPNELLRDAKGADGHRFIHWRYKPGQRMQLLVPVETWKAQIVLPIDALAQDGLETYVFRPNGKKLERRPVHVLHRDALNVVIANDGSVFPGDTVAMNGASQLQLALKNKSGGAPDPHAGHNH